MTLHEKMARAICCPEGCARGTGPFTHCVAPRLSRPAAAALAAVHEHLAEPSDAMLAALAREKQLLGSHLTIAQAWRAMLEAELP